MKVKLGEKTKADFEAWYESQNESWQYTEPEFKTFILLPIDFQTGVYKRYFRDYYLEIEVEFNRNNWKYNASVLSVANVVIIKYLGEYITPIIAEIAAINMAGEFREGELTE